MAMSNHLSPAKGPIIIPQDVIVSETFQKSNLYSYVSQWPAGVASKTVCQLLQSLQSQRVVIALIEWAQQLYVQVKVLICISFVVYLEKASKEIGV